jgi:hypothetical protein
VEAVGLLVSVIGPLCGQRVTKGLNLVAGMGYCHETGSSPVSRGTLSFGTASP